MKRITKSYPSVFGPPVFGPPGPARPAISSLITHSYVGGSLLQHQINAIRLGRAYSGDVRPFAIVIICLIEMKFREEGAIRWCVRVYVRVYVRMYVRVYVTLYVVLYVRLCTIGVMAYMIPCFSVLEDIRFIMEITVLWLLNVT